MIKCSKCSQAQPATEFYVVRKTGKRRDWCRTCVKSYNAEWQRANKDRVARTQRRSKLKLKYGLTELEWERTLDTQGGGCAICGAQPHPKQGIAVDHCHTTGRVRGILCSKCNRALGYFRDDVERLLRAATYLEANTPKSPSF
ncbi:endonuclease VII domain-containing protein [Streptomyces sp. NPDC049577]|uniref:endonuclease VII domain-containing protein n=1 Tax=Streptomyces sp. NPDC049577 TaxID=3155153 RepID=UPI00343AFA06